jgi:hypothetical protein
LEGSVIGGSVVVVVVVVVFVVVVVGLVVVVVGLGVLDVVVVEVVVVVGACLVESTRGGRTGSLAPRCFAGSFSDSCKYVHAQNVYDETVHFFIYSTPKACFSIILRNV